MSTLSGQVGPYTIEGEIGRGGMGVVYRASDPRLGRTVAIKALPEIFHDDAERLARFEREARALAALNHPNVAAIYGVEEHEGRNFLVLELVEGETLSQRLDRGSLPVDEALDICSQIASGLEAAHEAGVIHRDLKPANIRITPEGKAKVLDFGLARADEPATGTSHASDLPTLESPQTPHTPTVPGAVLGTAPYMSPEQARGRKVDKRTDIWSFGVVLYECLTGMSPFVGETATDSIGAILHKDVDLVLLPAQTPPMVRHLLERCLERDRSNRLRDIGDARIELDAARKGGPAPVAVVRPEATRPWSLIVLVALLAAIVSAAGVWFVAPRVETQETEPTRLQISVDETMDISGLALRTFALAPDGRSLIYSAGAAGITHLYERNFNDFERKEIAGTIGGRTPFFSPDGGRVGFFSQGLIKWVSVSGGSPMTLCPAPGLHYGAAWLDDGRIVFGSNVIDYPLIVDDEGGESRKFEITPFDTSPGAYRWPHALPDGEHVLFSYHRPLDGIEGPHIVVVSMETGVARRLIRGTDASYIEPGYLIFGQGGDILAAPFDLDRLEVTGDPRSLGFIPVQGDAFGALNIATDGRHNLVFQPRQATRVAGRLVWVDRSGGIEVIDEESTSYSTPRLSPDDSRIVYWTSRVGADADVVGELTIRVFDLARERSIPVTFNDISAGYGIWAPDPSRVIFMQFDADGFAIRSVNADGGGQIELVAEQEFARLMTSFAPDGESGLLYEVNPVSNRDIWLWRTDGESSPLLTTPANERAGVISPDGEWFAYVSDQSGQDEVYVTSYPDAEGRWLVSSGGGVEPLWGPDGTELFYRMEDRLMRVGVDAGESFVVTDPSVLFRGSFALDPFGNANYDITNDGQRFLMVQALNTEYNLFNVVLNFQQELKAMFNPMR